MSVDNDRFLLEACVADDAANQLGKAYKACAGKAFLSRPYHQALLTFYAAARHEIKRCFRIWIQAFVSPAITRLMFFIIFQLIHLTAIDHPSAAQASLGPSVYKKILIPGVIFSALMQEACRNTTNSLLPTKYHGVLQALLVVPVSFFSIILGYAAGGCVRVWGVCALLLLDFKCLGSPCLPLAFGRTAFLFPTFAVIGSLLGILIALIVHSFNQMALIQQLIVATLFLFSGAMFPLERSPALFLKLTRFNPFFYLNKVFFEAWTGKAMLLFFESAVLSSLILIFLFSLWNVFYLKKNMEHVRYKLKTLEHALELTSDFSRRFLRKLFC